jgi:hypothetical protein
MTMAVAPVEQGTPSEVTHQEHDDTCYHINQQGKEALRVIRSHLSCIVNYPSPAPDVHVQTEH